MMTNEAVVELLVEVGRLMGLGLSVALKGMEVRPELNTVPVSDLSEVDAAREDAVKRTAGES